MTIEDVWSFSSISFIILSRGLSIKILTEVQHCYGRLSQIIVSPLWKIEYPDCYITTT